MAVGHCGLARRIDECDQVVRGFQPAQPRVVGRFRDRSWHRLGGCHDVADLGLPAAERAEGRLLNLGISPSAVGPTLSSNRPPGTTSVRVASQLSAGQCVSLALGSVVAERGGRFAAILPSRLGLVLGSSLVLAGPVVPVRDAPPVVDDAVRVIARRSMRAAHAATRHPSAFPSRAS